jgi:hypothetical protein
MRLGRQEAQAAQSIMLSFLDGMVADLGPLRSGWRREQRVQFQVDVPQGDVVGEEGPVDFGQALQDGGIGGQVLAHSDEGADDEKAHFDCLGAVENRGGHERAMFGEGKGTILPVATASRL